MKILLFVFIGLLILQNCGKKSEPEYQGKNKQINRI